MKYPLMKNNILREDLDAVIGHLRQEDPRLTHGSWVKAFEEQWSQWLGVKYSVFVNSGASANLITMALLRVRHPQGGEVIVPPLTWVSDIAAVMQNGFQPVFADIDRRSLAMDTDQVLDRLSDRTRAVFLTHAQGFDGLTDLLLAEMKRRDIPLIEDVCESHGATHRGIKLGCFGWISNFSYYYAHHLSTIEGGMICTDDEQVYQQARMFRSHGLVRESSDLALRTTYQQQNPELNPDFIFAFPAYNVRNTEIGGILGCSQLKRLDVNIRDRNRHLKRFLERIDPGKYQTDFNLEGSSNYAFNLILRHPDPVLAERLMARMREEGIEFRRGSAGGGNQLRQPYLKSLFPEGYYLQFPEVEHIHFYGFYLGNYPTLGDAQVDEICRILNSV